MKLFKKMLITAASFSLLTGCTGGTTPNPPKPTNYSITYKVNGLTDLSRVNERSSILPAESEEGKKVSVHIAAASGYDYMSFMPSVPGDYEKQQEFYDQFIDYNLREDTFSFDMPKCNVIVNFNIQEHADRYDVTFASVSHASFSFAGSDDNPFAAGDKVHFTISIESGYEITEGPSVVGDSSISIAKSVTDVYSFDMPNKAVTITATVEQKTTQYYSCTLASVSHINMRKHASVPSLDELEEYDNVIIVVTPEAGYELVGTPFIVNDASIVVTAAPGVTNGYRFTMPGKNVTFSCNVKESGETTKYAVNFASVEHASFSISGTSEISFSEGTLVIFYVNLDSGYRLSGKPYVVGDSSIEVDNYSTTGTTFCFSMPAKAVTISATVESIPSYAVTLDNVEHVTMTTYTPSDLSNVEEGTNVIIKVIPATGYELDGYPFIVDDATVEVKKSSSVENGYYFSMPAKAVILSVNVKEATVTKYTITFAAVTGLTFSKHSTSENPCEAGEPFGFNITIADGVSLVGSPFIIEDTSIEIIADQWGTYYFSMPEFNVTVSANVSGTPRTLDHISLGDKKTEYQINEEFVKPVVYAHYDNKDVETVAASSVKCTGYDLSTAGEYTVTVSFTKSGVTKTATYDITVSGKTPSASVDLTKRYVLARVAADVYYVKFNADGTGYYERNQPTQSKTSRVNFKYAFVTENYWRIYDPEYVGSVAYDSFYNGYRMFAHPDLIDWQESFFYSYVGSIEVRLLTCNSYSVDTSKTAYRSFALEA